MQKATIELFNDQLHTGYFLLDTNNQTNWDLAHYIADNAIGKILMLKLIEKGISQKRVENMKFPEILDFFCIKFPTIDIDKNSIKNQHSKGRNPFQHRISTTYLSIRKSHVKQYLNSLEELMRKCKIYIENYHYDFGKALNNSNIEVISEIDKLIQSFESSSQSIIDDLIKLRNIAKKKKREDILEWIHGEFNGFSKADDPKIPLYRKEIPVSIIKYEKIFQGNISRNGNAHIMAQFDLSNTYDIGLLIDHQNDKYFQMMFPSMKDEKGFDTYVRWEQQFIKKIIQNVRLQAIDYLNELKE